MSNQSDPNLFPGIIADAPIDHPAEDGLPHAVFQTTVDRIHQEATVLNERTLPADAGEHEPVLVIPQRNDSGKKIDPLDLPISDIREMVLDNGAVTIHLDERVLTRPKLLKSLKRLKGFIAGQPTEVAVAEAAVGTVLVIALAKLAISGVRHGRKTTE